MRDTAEDVHQDAPSADPEPDDPPRTDPDPEPTPQEPDAPQPARVAAGPLLAMSTETVAATGAALWHVGGWTAVGLGAAGLAGAGAAAVERRRRAGSWRRTRTWSTSSGGRRAPASFGRASSGGARRSRSGMPSLGGSGRRAGAGSRTGSRSGGAAKRAGGRGFPGSGKRSPGAGRRAAAAGRRAATPVLRGASNTARRTKRTGAGALDRATAGAIRGRAAARAARQASREGASPRAAGRAARAALKDAHRTTPVKGTWRRTLGSAAWGLGGWGIAWGSRLIRRVADRIRLHHGDPDAEPGTPRERINDTVDRPAGAAGGHTGGDMPRNRSGGGAPQFVHAAEELAEAFRRYEPPPGAGGMVQMYADVGALPDAMDQIAQGINVLSDRCRGELPLHPAIAELVGELAKVQSHMASVAAEIRPAIERLHAEDLDRHRAPRPSEERWNVA